jgi:hypothetical protein
MPVKQVVYDLEAPGGKVAAQEMYAIAAREVIASNPQRYTLKRPDGDFVVRNGAVPIPEEPLSDDERKARDEEAAKRGYEEAVGAAYLPGATLVRGTTGGAGTIKGGRDLTRSTGVEVTKEQVTDFRLANDFPEAAQAKVDAGEPIQPIEPMDDGSSDDEKPRTRKKS